MMNALRWVLLGALLFAFLLFAVANWSMVGLVLPNGAVAPVPLPLLLLGAFLLGLLPAQLWHSVADARLRRQQARTQKLLEDTLARPVPAPPAPVAAPPAQPPPPLSPTGA